MKYYKYNKGLFGHEVYRVKDNNTWWFYSKHHGWVTPKPLKKWSRYPFTPNIVEITEKEAFIEIL